MADTVGQSAKLPSIKSLDMEKIKSESLYNPNIPINSALVMSAPPLSSPTSIYPGPPPPYSYPSSTTSSVIGSQASGATGAHGNYPSSATTHSTSGDEKEQPVLYQRSLPSITEALSSSEAQPISISSLLSTTTPQKPPSTARSPISPKVARSFLDNIFKGSQDAVSNHNIASAPRISDPPTRANRPMYSSQQATGHSDSRLPNINAISTGAGHDAQTPTDLHHPISHSLSNSRPGASPIQNTRTSPSHDRYAPPPLSIAQARFNSSYHPAYSYPPTTPGLSSYRTPTLPPEPSWQKPVPSTPTHEELKKPYSNTKYTSPPPRQAYGESVKRHLDIFEFESSLNEIAELSGRTLDWSRQYRVNAHQTQRSGPIPGSLPPLAEVEDMVQQQEKTLEAMSRIRDVIYKQQQALQEQRNYDKMNAKSSTYDADEDSNYPEKADGSGGFAGADPKKRRGRAAPPGRCHSCNRAETPEWRRGPDGARTLCNACGLHYAKLTRKMGPKPSNGSSNLRPKESTPSSPS